MADVKLSALTAAPGVASEDLVYLVKGGTSYKTTVGELVTGLATTTSVSTVANNLATEVVDRIDSYTGFAEVPFLAGSLTPQTTGGCASLAQATIGSGPQVGYLAFDAASTEAAHGWLPIPRRCWSDTVPTTEIEFKVFSYPASGSGNVVWKIDLAVSDPTGATQPIPTAFSDSGQATHALASGAIADGTVTVTVTGGFFGSNSQLFFRISRLGANGSDTLAADAHLLAVKVLLPTFAAKDQG